METVALLCGLLGCLGALVAMALSNREKDRTIEKLVLMGKSRTAREYGFTRSLERVSPKDVSIQAPPENGGPYREREPLPDSETAALFNRPG